MKLKELQLLKYGKFDGQILKFPPETPNGPPGLHIVFGHNEDGKSTALRALKALLFGIGRNNTDDFRFGNDLLSVGAVLENSAGQTEEIQRWKKQPYLRDKEGRSLDAAVLSSCLGSVDADSFARFFGLDHDELRRGSEMLLHEKGDVSTSIFSAGLGALDVRAVLDDLETKASELYKPRAKNPSINAAIADYSEKARAIRDAALPAREYREKEEQLAAAKQHLDELLSKQSELGKRKAKLERIRRARPLLAKLRDLHEQLTQAGAVAPLPDGFARERRTLSDTLKKLEDDERNAAVDIDSHAREIAALVIPEALLRQAQTITRLQQSLKSYSEGMRDLPLRNAEKASAENAASGILKQLRPGANLPDAETLRISTAQSSRLLSLGNEEQSLRNKFATLKAEVSSLEDELREKKDAEARMPEPRASTGLRNLADRIRKHGTLEEKLTGEEKKIARMREQAGRELKRLPLWNGTLEDLAALKIPAAETIADFDKRLQAAQTKIEKLADKIEDKEADIKSCHAEIAKLRKQGGEIPTEPQLRAARERREGGWKLIRRAWLQGENDAAAQKDYDPSLPLPEAYEKAVHASDALGDHMYRDASRVGKHADCLAKIESITRERDELAAEKKSRSDGLEQLLNAWHALWMPLGMGTGMGIEPGTVAEMLAWIVQKQALLNKFELMCASERECDELKKQIRAYIQELASALTAGGADVAPGITLDQSLEQTQRFCDNLEQLTRDRKTLKDSIDDTNKRWKQKAVASDIAGTALNEWQEKWARAVAILQLSPDARVSEANEVAARTLDLFKQLDQIPELDRRIGAIGETIQQFESEVKSLSQQIDPALDALRPEDAAQTLNQRLGQARVDDARRKELLKQQQNAERKKKGAADQIQSLRKRLADLCAIAQCDDPARIEELEKRNEWHRGLQEKIVEAKDALLNVGDGLSIEELFVEAGTEIADEFESQFLQVTKELDDLKFQLDPAYDARSKINTELSAMDGGAGAANVSAEAQSILAQIRDDTERYVRLRMAAELLKREIERYRNENQTPLLRHAGALFAALTHGSFTSVRADSDDKGQNMLLGIRGNQPALGVEAMSDGTRDQLYLALRLAHLQLYLDDPNNEPLPFVVDDVLVNFDDKRSAAAFALLYQISKRIQIIVFTHHKHMIALAQSALAGSGGYTQSSSTGTLEVHSFVPAPEVIHQQEAGVTPENLLVETPAAG